MECRTGKAVGPWAIASSHYGFEIRGNVRFLGRRITDDEWRVGLCLIHNTIEPDARKELMQLLDPDPEIEEALAMEDIMAELSEKAARERRG